MENRRNDLQNRLNILEQQLDENPNIVADLTSEITNLNNQIAVKQAEITAKRTAAAPQAEIDILEYEKYALQENRREKIRNKNQLRPTYLNSLRSAIANYDTRITGLDTQIENDQKLIDDNDKADNNVRGLIHQVREVRGMSEDWESKHGDNYMKLMAYWDMLETYGKSHQNPWFRSMKDVRDEFTEGFDQDKDTAPVSQAKIVEVEFWNKYKQRHAA